MKTLGYVLLGGAGLLGVYFLYKKFKGNGAQSAMPPMPQAQTKDQILAKIKAASAQNSQSGSAATKNLGVGLSTNF
jgi:hypothetical protein